MNVLDLVVGIPIWAVIGFSLSVLSVIGFIVRAKSNSKDSFIDGVLFLFAVPVIWPFLVWIWWVDRRSMKHFEEMIKDLNTPL